VALLDVVGAQKADRGRFGRCGVRAGWRRLTPVLTVCFLKMGECRPAKEFRASPVAYDPSINLHLLITLSGATLWRSIQRTGL
jgi:hypothetical protein